MSKVKLFLLAFVAVFALAVGFPALADDATIEATAQNLEVVEPTLLPNNPLYFLKEWGRGIQSFFTFGQLKKAELQQKFASERLLELKKLVEEGKVNSDILKRATEKYEKTIERIKNRAEKIKEKVSENEEVNKFIDKFTKQQILHEKILEKLENQVPPEVFDKIKEAREKHLERFGEVMQKLEPNQERMAERIQNALQNAGEQSGEIMKRIQKNMPDDIKREINRIRERARNQEVVCTMDAKQCPDGSYVGRVGPNCEFAPCPGQKNDCRNLWWFDKNSSDCQQKQFCGLYMYQGLQTFEDKKECEEALTAE